MFNRSALGSKYRAAMLAVFAFMTCVFASSSAFSTPLDLPCKFIDQYGGDPTGVSDSTPGWNAIVNPTGGTPSGVCISFGVGTYKFNSGLNYTAPNLSSSLTIKGVGMNLSKLTWPSGQGIVISGSAISSGSDRDNFTIENLSILTGAGRGVGNGILLSHSNGLISLQASTITNVTFSGINGVQDVNSWDVGVYNNGWSRVYYTNDEFWGPSTGAGGYGLIMQGYNNVDQAIVQNISSCGFYLLQNGIVYGGKLQGVSIVSSNFTNDYYGVWVPAAADGIEQLLISNSQFEPIGTAIFDEGAMPTLGIINNLFILGNGLTSPIPNQTGILIKNSLQYQIIGNDFLGGSLSAINAGIDIQSSTAGNSGGIITGNNIHGFSTGYGILLESGARNVNIQSNKYSDNVSDYSNLGGVTNKIGGGSP